MTKIGFIGLGLMGNPQCKNLVKAGHEVTVWNRTSSRMDEVLAIGGNGATSALDASKQSEIIVTMLSDSIDVEEVVLGDNGVIKGAASGSVVIDMSTISPSVTRMISGKLSENGIHMLDAPVSGGVTGAEDGTLSIMVGGDEAVFERCRPILESMGSRITYCGGNGMGQVTKLANQIVGLGTLGAMCEGLVFATRAGGDPDTLLRALSGGAANSWMLENVAPKIFEGDFAPGFMVNLAQKDLRLILESAAEMNVPLFTTPLVSQVFRSAQQTGAGDEGIQAYIKMLERLAGAEVRVSNG